MIRLVPLRLPQSWKFVVSACVVFLPVTCIDWSSAILQFPLTITADVVTPAQQTSLLLPSSLSLTLFRSLHLSFPYLTLSFFCFFSSHSIHFYVLVFHYFPSFLLLFTASPSSIFSRTFLWMVLVSLCMRERDTLCVWEWERESWNETISCTSFHLSLCVFVCQWLSICFFCFLRQH